MLLRSLKRIDHASRSIDGLWCATCSTFPKISAGNLLSLRVQTLDFDRSGCVSGRSLPGQVVAAGTCCSRLSDARSGLGRSRSHRTGAHQSARQRGEVSPDRCRAARTGGLQGARRAAGSPRPRHRPPNKEPRADLRTFSRATNAEQRPDHRMAWACSSVATSSTTPRPHLAHSAGEARAPS